MKIANRMKQGSMTYEAKALRFAFTFPLCQSACSKNTISPIKSIKIHTKQNAEKRATKSQNHLVLAKVWEYVF